MKENPFNQPDSVINPNTLLRLESAVVFAACVVALIRLGCPGWLVVVLALAPDLAMLGYLFNPRVGAISYNLAHFQLLAIALAAFGFFSSLPVLLWIGLIWLAHIEFDRTMAYGLKLESFQATHLGRIGK